MKVTKYRNYHKVLLLHQIMMYEQIHCILLLFAKKSLTDKEIYSTLSYLVTTFGVRFQRGQTTVRPLLNNLL